LPLGLQLSKCSQKRWWGQPNENIAH